MSDLRPEPALVVALVYEESAPCLRVVAGTLGDERRLLSWLEDPDDVGGNLVSIFTEGPRCGAVAFGFVSRELIDAGYAESA
jgi:hypothetical protein